MVSADNLCKHLCNSLDPEQDLQNVGPELDPKCLTPERIFQKVSIFKKNQQTTKNMKNYPGGRVTVAVYVCVIMFMYIEYSVKL